MNISHFDVKGKSMLFAGAAVVVCLAAFFIVRGVSAARPDVSERWAIYIENLKPESRILALSATQHYTASKEFAAKVLALVDIRASVEISAWAEVSYFVDASDPSRWAISWDRATGVLELAAPEPDCLLPAVRTETIEVRPKGANLVTNAVFRLKEEAAKMRGELSADLHVRARATLSDETVRSGIRSGLESFARAFCASALGAQPERVIVRLPGDAR